MIQSIFPQSCHSFCFQIHIKLSPTGEMHTAPPLASILGSRTNLALVQKPSVCATVLAFPSSYFQLLLHKQQMHLFRKFGKDREEFNYYAGTLPLGPNEPCFISTVVWIPVSGWINVMERGLVFPTAFQVHLARC